MTQLTDRLPTQTEINAAMIRARAERSRAFTGFWNQLFGVDTPRR